ncbi:23 kDa integral membrane protein-like [Saccoglossus kowalevskii]|uniref:Tetraspanin n=1 Tax=Saccoglossus kowalevskii TaxID=10224 RepID=A0ABM0MD56_SACKO|nr:PREDICTED: CD151 antigen-like [Saccoglossus kowalevskii]
MSKYVSGMSMKCVRLILYLFNLMLMFSGLTVIGICIFVKYQHRFDEYGPVNFRLALYGIIVVSGVVSLTGCLGCCGAKYENRYCLGFYFGIMAFIMLVELTVGILLVVTKGKLVDQITDSLADMVSEVYYRGDEDSPVVIFIDWLQTKFKCCGSSGYEDYEIPPRSCFCFFCDNKLTTDVFTKGCAKAVSQYADQYIRILYAIILGIGIAQLIGLIFAIQLLLHIRKQRTRRNLHTINNNKLGSTLL